MAGVSDKLALLTLEQVSKEYSTLRPQRLHRRFARLGGLVPEDVLLETGDEDEDDDDDDDIDEAGVDRLDDELVEGGSDGPAVLQHVSLAASGGSCIGLIGPPRSGKSLLLKIVAGIVPPTSGRVVARGTIAPALDVVAFSLPKGTPLSKALPVLAGMVGVSSREVRDRLPAIFELLGGGELTRAHASNLDSRRRRDLVLAMMLSLDADIILVDCPLPVTPLREHFVERLLELKRRGSLVIVAAQTLKSIEKLPDRLVLLEKGRIVGDEPVEAATG